MAIKTLPPYTDTEKNFVRLYFEALGATKFNELYAVLELEERQDLIDLIQEALNGHVSAIVAATTLIDYPDESGESLN